MLFHYSYLKINTLVTFMLEKSSSWFYYIITAISPRELWTMVVCTKHACNIRVFVSPERLLRVKWVSCVLFRYYNRTVLRDLKWYPYKIVVRHQLQDIQSFFVAYDALNGLFKRMRGSWKMLSLVMKQLSLWMWRLIPILKMLCSKRSCSSFSSWCEDLLRKSICLDCVATDLLLVFYFMNYFKWC